MTFNNNFVWSNKTLRILKHFFSKKQQKWIEILRLIINLVPSNLLQEVIPGDVATLPHFAQWRGLELFEGEELFWTAEDIKCAFYIFKLPAEWLRWFVLNMPLYGEQIGRKPGVRYWFALGVIPMGWVSAVGICQMAMRRLATLPPPQGAGIPGHREIRKDMALPINWRGRILRFFQEYIDNSDSGSVIGTKGKTAENNDAREMQKNRKDGFDHWGVPMSTEKEVAGLEGAAWWAAGFDGNTLGPQEAAAAARATQVQQD